MRAQVCVMVVLVFCATLVALSGGSLWAGDNRTPASKWGWEIMPYQFHLGDRPEMKIAAQHQGYEVRTWANEVVSLTPNITVTDVMGIYASGVGVGMINTHGSSQGQAVEVYPYTTAGFASCDSAYTWYVSHGYSGRVYQALEENWGFHISIYYDTAVSEWTYLSDAIIHNQTCYGLADVWNGARVWFGPAGDCTIGESMANVRELWQGLDGVRGKARRVAGQAYLDAPNLAMGGNGNTTLAPVAEQYYPQENTEIGEDSVDAWVTFDTKMDIGIDPVGLVSGDGNVVVKDERWVRGEKDTLRFTLKSVVEDACCATVSYEARSSGGMALDGNRNPPGTDGEGPNGDDYVICYDCTYTDPNYAARYGSEWAYRDGDGVVVGWHVEAEIETREYVVEGEVGGDWEVLSVVGQGEVVAPDVYEALVPGGYEYYRVLEVDERGRRGESHPLGVSADEPALVSRVKEGQRCLAAGRGGRSMVRKPSRCEFSEGGSSVASGGEVPDWVIYGPESLLVACGPAISWFESQGEVVDTAHAPSDYY